MVEVGTPYRNSLSGKVEEVMGRHPFEALGLCVRCLGIVEPPDEPGGVYTCCNCGLKFIVVGVVEGN